jgi:hypothetical protein
MRESIPMKSHKDFRHSFRKNVIYVELSNSWLVSALRMNFMSEKFLWMSSRHNCSLRSTSRSEWGSNRSASGGDRACCLRNSVTAFVTVPWLRIVLFIFGSAYVHRPVAWKRKEYARAMIVFLHNTDRDSWRYLVTGDKSGFFLRRSPGRTWTLARDHMIINPMSETQNTIVHIDFHLQPASFLHYR